MVVGDCPGYRDNRHPILKIANMVNMVKIMGAAKRKSILIAVEMSNIVVLRSEAFKDLQRMVENFFGGIENLKKNPHSLKVIITKWTPSEEFETFDDVLDMIAEN